MYYANHALATTQWPYPRTGMARVRQSRIVFLLVGTWDRKILDDNKVVYVDLLNKKTTYTDPRLAFAKETAAASTTALRVLHSTDMSGANTGIGFQVVRACHGCSVIMPCRVKEQAEVDINRIKNERPHAKCEWLHLDLEIMETGTL